MKDGAEHHMNCAEGAWGLFRHTGASVTNSAGWWVCLAAETSVRMLSVARFFISIYFLSASSVVVYRLTQQHQLWNAASYYALRSYIGFTWSQPTTFAWEPTRWQENQNADGFHIGSCVKSHCHIFCFVHKKESFPTLSVQTLGLHTDWAGGMGSVINEIDWIYHQTLSLPCRIADRSKSEHLHLDQLPSQVFLALISEESSVSWEE